MTSYLPPARPSPVDPPGSDDFGKRVSLDALIAVRAGQRPRLVFHVHAGRRGDKRKGFTESEYARLLDAGHQHLGAPSS
jgi:hypothetical protein